jgi:flagellar biosynthetic protein FliQ
MTMDPTIVIDMTRDAIVASVLVSGPVLIVGIIVGLLIGLLQALTQVQDQTVSFVPKLLAMVLTLTFCLPWVVDYMHVYCQRCFGEVPTLRSTEP